MQRDIVTTSTRPDLEGEAEAAFRERWPEFIFHDPVSRNYIGRVQEYFADYDILVLVDGRVAAGGWGVPFVWSGDPADLPSGYDGALVRAVEDHEAHRTPTAFSFMAAAVHRDFDKQGLAAQVLAALTERAGAAGIEHVLAPIRPTWKHKYPLVSMDEYAGWPRDDGLSIDPWIRVHQRMGARIVQVAADSMVISGTVAEWEKWADMPFPVSGRYVVPDALNLVDVDRAEDVAVYREENLWMQHR